MINFTEIDELTNLLNIVSEMIPEGTKKEIELDGMKISLIKEDGTIKINTKTKFDDTIIKEQVKSYQTNIRELNDDIFVEISEELSSVLNLKEFDTLLNLKEYSQEQANKVSGMIDIASKIARKHLQKKIENLVELYDRF